MKIKENIIIILSAISCVVKPQSSPKFETFKTEIFLNDDEVNSGLYEGQVIGRRRFGNTQKPHGFGTINYFTNDKFHRLNYTGDWVNGVREGNGTTYFKDGSVYIGEYSQGVEDGTGQIKYRNGNLLEGEFEKGKIHGHVVFKYPNGDQREGFFKNNILEGQVVFTKANGRTKIEVWKNGTRSDGSTEGPTTTSTEDLLKSPKPSEKPDAKDSSTKDGEKDDHSNDINDKSADKEEISLGQEIQKKASKKSGDNRKQFFFSANANKSFRTPKLSDPNGENDPFSMLRKKSLSRDRDFLRQIFDSVHRNKKKRKKRRRK